MGWDGQNRISIKNKMLKEIFANNNVSDIMKGEDEFGLMTDLEKQADYFYFYPDCAYYSFYPKTISEVTSNYMMIIERDIEGYEGYKDEIANRLKVMLSDIKQNIDEINNQYEYVSWLYQTESEYALYEYDSSKGLDKLSLEE